MDALLRVSNNIETLLFDILLYFSRSKGLAKGYNCVEIRIAYGTCVDCKARQRHKTLVGFVGQFTLGLSSALEVHLMLTFRTCLHGDGGPQVGGVTRLSI